MNFPDDVILIRENYTVVGFTYTKGLLCLELAKEKKRRIRDEAIFFSIRETYFIFNAVGINH